MSKGAVVLLFTGLILIGVLEVATKSYLLSSALGPVGTFIYYFLSWA